MAHIAVFLQGVDAMVEPFEAMLTQGTGVQPYGLVVIGLPLLMSGIDGGPIQFLVEFSQCHQ